MPTTLLAVTGLSPAIVTETLWVLAKRKPAIFPDRVVFITTATGKERIEQQLFTPRADWDGLTVWDALRRKIKAPTGTLVAEPPAVITMPDAKSGRALPLDDIRSPAENSAAAEFIFGQVWNVVRDRDQRLIASIAGGRKTMGALLHAAVSLIGRETDRLTHILVAPPFDTLPGFFFPGQPGGDLPDPADRLHQTRNARPALADVPFVPLRNRFKELDDLPGSFLALRERLAATLTRDAERPVPLRIDHSRELLEIDGRPQPVRPRALAILHFILACQQKNQIPPDQTTAADAYNKLIARDPARFGQPRIGTLAAEDFRRELSHLRDLLRNDPWQPASRTLRQPPFTLEISGQTTASQPDAS